MEFTFGLIIVLVLAETLEMAPAYQSSEVDDSGHINTRFTSSSVPRENHSPVQGKTYAEFHTPAGASLQDVKPPTTNSNKLTSRTYAEFHTSSEIHAEQSEPVEPLAFITPVYESMIKEVNEQNKLTSRTYAEFHTSSEIHAEKSEPVEPLTFITPVYESMIKEVNEQRHIRDHYTIYNDTTGIEQDLNQSVIDEGPPSLTQRSTRQFLDILTEHDLVKITLPRVPSTPKPKVLIRGVLDVLLPPSRLQSMKSFVDYFHGLLSSTF